MWRQLPHVTFPWCSSPEGAVQPAPLPWLGPFFEPGRAFLARGSVAASLSIFVVLGEALRHRWSPVDADREVLSSRVAGQAEAEARMDYLAGSYNALVATGYYVKADGDPVVPFVRHSPWVVDAERFVEAIAALQYTIATILSVDEQVPIASGVRYGSIIGTWTVPRYHQCRRVHSVSVVSQHGTVELDAGGFDSVIARYDRLVPMFRPDDPPKQIHPGGSSGVVFDLSGMSSVPPTGYESDSPPPNCEYRYLLLGDAGGAEITINGRVFSPRAGGCEVTRAIETVNTVSQSAIIPGPLFLQEMWQWTGSMPPPNEYVHRFRRMVYWGLLPVGNWGGSERVAFTVSAVVEAFSGGPLTRNAAGSPPPRVDVWPRITDPGMTCHARFHAAGTGPWTAVLDGIEVARGTLSGEVTSISFEVPPLPRPALLSVTSGSSGELAMLYDRIEGAPVRPYCEILSYEPSLEDEEQPGVILSASSPGIVVRPMEGVAWPSGDFTLYLRIRVAPGDVFSFVGCEAAIDESGGLSVSSSAGVLSASLALGRIADIAIVRTSGDLVLRTSAGSLSSLAYAADPALRVYAPIVLGRMYEGRMYRAILMNRGISGAEFLQMAIHGAPDRREDVAFDLDLHVGSGLHLPDRTTFLSQADALPPLGHIFPATQGRRTVVRLYRTGPDPEPEALVTVPAGSAPERVEVEVLDGFESPVTLTFSAGVAVLGTIVVQSPGFYVLSFSTPSYSVPKDVLMTHSTHPLPRAFRCRFVYCIRQRSD